MRRLTTRRPGIRRLAVITALASLTLGLTAVAHADEPDLTVTGRAVDAAGNGIAKISVYAISDADLQELESEPDEEEWDDEDYFEDWEIVHIKTAPSGRFTSTDGRWTTGDWHFAFVDERRVDAPFAVTEVERVLGSPSTDIGEVALRPGAVINGTLRTAVTGKVVPWAEVVRSTTVSLFDDLSDVDSTYTSSKGAFRYTGLEAGVHRLWVGFDEEWDYPTTPSARIRLTEGQVVDATVTTTIPCRTSFTATPAKGKVTFKVIASGSDYGVPATRGSVKITSGTKGITTITMPSQGGTATKVVAQGAGKRTYTATYSGGDCRPWKAGRTITVR